MRTLIVTTGAACALALPAWAQTTPAPEAPAKAAATTPQAAAQPQDPAQAERLHAMRQALLARIAVYDAVEQRYRAPTERERAALGTTVAPSASPRTVALANGAVAVKGDVGEMSFLVVELQPDGKAAIGHAASMNRRTTFAARPQPAATARAATAPATQPAKEARHAQ